MSTAGTTVNNKLVQTPKFIGVSLTMEAAGSYMT